MNLTLGIKDNSVVMTGFISRDVKFIKCNIDMQKHKELELRIKINKILQDANN